MIFYEYRGNTFGLDEMKGWVSKNKKYELVQMKISEEDVYLPDNYEGISIVTLDLKSEEKKKYQKVKRLYIPKGITYIKMDNNIFPELEEVHVDQGNEKYSANGKMIFTEAGTHLEYCLVTKGHSIKIPDEIHFSANIKDIPDASIFQKGGVFEECISLKSVIKVFADYGQSITCS